MANAVVPSFHVERERRSTCTRESTRGLWPRRPCYRPIGPAGFGFTLLLGSSCESQEEESSGSGETCLAYVWLLKPLRINSFPYSAVWSPTRDGRARTWQCCVYVGRRRPDCDKTAGLGMDGARSAGSRTARLQSKTRTYFWREQNFYVEYFWMRGSPSTFRTRAAADEIKKIGGWKTESIA